MSWATEYISRLQRGETVQFRPRGGSMTGIIESGQLVTVAPVAPADVRPRDVVLCTVAGAQYLHLVRDVRNGRAQIANNRGYINGWTDLCHVYGKLIAAED